ncbi:Arginine--tRNA ligase [Colletotrichum scovillei]|nr:Arginine--tRNA ligase [Colletotrichum scovillei]
MFKHLTAKTSIGLDTVIDGGFTLEFHLAYPVWKREHSPRRDQRVTGDGLPLRKSTDLSFLPGAPRSDRIAHGLDYLHEAQTSICVTGRDTSHWTAIGLTDSYFEDDSDPNNEYLLPFYVTDPYPDPDMTSCELDALSIANLTADNVSVTDPREYFLLVVKFHVVRITQHWMNVLFKLKDMIDEYLSSPHIPLTRRESSLGTMRGESYAIEASEAWLGQTSDLVIQWILLLTKTIKAWNKFFDQDASRIVCQSSEDGLNHMNDSLYEISRSLDELRAIREEMEELKVKVERFEKKLGLHVAVGDNRAIVLQYWNVTILQFISPFAVAGTIMQAGLVFGHPVLCFTVLASAVAFIMWALKPTLTWLAMKARLEEADNAVPQQLIQGLQLENGVQTTSYSLPTYPTMAYHRFQGVSIDKSNQVM